MCTLVQTLMKVRSKKPGRSCQDRLAQDGCHQILTGRPWSATNRPRADRFGSSSSEFFASSVLALYSGLYSCSSSLPPCCIATAPAAREGVSVESLLPQELCQQRNPRILWFSRAGSLTAETAPVPSLSLGLIRETARSIKPEESMPPAWQPSAGSTDRERSACSSTITRQARRMPRLGSRGHRRPLPSPDPLSPGRHT